MNLLSFLTAALTTRRLVVVYDSALLSGLKLFRNYEKRFLGFLRVVSKHLNKCNTGLG